jgi:hypothetical protein
MASDAVDFRIVGGNGAIEVEAQDFALVGRIILDTDLGIGGRILGDDDVAGIQELVTAMIADAVVELMVRTSSIPSFLSMGGLHSDA